MINIIINVVDDLMGVGKTSWAIQKMNGGSEYKFIYITPYLKEISRIKKQCKNIRFYEPNVKNGKGSKLNDFHNLLQKEKNIISTHSLFSMATDTTRELINAGNYILILDEVMNVIEELKLRKDDIKLMKSDNLIEVQDNLVIWNKDKIDYDSEYNYIKKMALNKCLFIVNDTVLVWTFPINIFECFKDIYILTYLFEGQIQKYYYDLYNVQYKYWSIKKADSYYLLSSGKTKRNVGKFKINIIDNDKINNIGENENSLSATWYLKNKKEPIIKVLKNNLYNYFFNKCQSKTNEVLWTTFKEHMHSLKGKGYTKGFLSLNARATNDYKHTKYLAYCCNRYLNPFVKHFFQQNNVSVNEDMYALSEMLQWIWRSAIREGNEIWIYIPSRRMRKLLQNWLEN